MPGLTIVPYKSPSGRVRHTAANCVNCNAPLLARSSLGATCAQCGARWPSHSDPVTCQRLYARMFASGALQPNRIPPMVRKRASEMTDEELVEELAPICEPRLAPHIVAAHDPSAPQDHSYMKHRASCTCGPCVGKAMGAKRRSELP